MSSKRNNSYNRYENGRMRGSRNESGIKSAAKAFLSVVTKGVSGCARSIGSFFVRVWSGVPKDTGHWLAIVSAVGVLLLVSVIVLAGRMSKLSDKITELRKTTLVLQNQLADVTYSMEDDAKEVAARPIATVTPGLDNTPVPTKKLSPTPTPEANRYVVCIDAGHGDWDGGAVLSDAGRRELRVEKEDNLWMAKQLQAALEAYDIAVVLTREADLNPKLKERTQIANAAGADLLISFHRNSIAVEPGETNEEVNGAEIWVHNSKPEDAVALAGKLMQVISSVGGMRNRGVKFGSMTGEDENYEINRSANMTSMLVEYGFVTSAGDNEAYDKNGPACAKAMAKTIYEWLLTQKE